jgi:ADP-ribose pyrophosphatase YjhB (NUDIX family)
VDLYYFDDDPRGNGLLLVYEASVEGRGPDSGRWQPESPETSAASFFLPENLPQPLCGGGHDRAIEAWRLRALDRWQPGEPMRFCPHCTHALEERLAFDRLRKVCPACGFVHFRTPKVGVSVLVESAGQVLLVQRAIEPGQGKWGLPAGFVEWDEAPEAAATRECLEETGLLLTDLEFLEVSHYRRDFRGPGINLTYRGQVAGGSPRPGEDAARVRWFSPHDLPSPEMIAFRTHHLLLERWRQSHDPGFDPS